MIDSDVTIEERDEDGIPAFAIKITSALIELNVTIPQSEISQLKMALSKDWASGTIRLGTSAGAPVYWCAAEHGNLSVLIGHDDQTWDIGLTLPASVVPMIFDSLPSAAGEA
jgi:hypothetical protein